MYSETAKDVLNKIMLSPTAFHVIETAKTDLIFAGFRELKESEVWELQEEGKYYVTRNDSSLIAFTVPKKDYKGFRIMASHSDSPCPKLKEKPEICGGGVVRLNVEQYGGMLLAPWFDRPLSVAGRIFVREGDRIRSDLVDLDRDVAVIPSLAIHMNREANSGYKYSFQKDMLPIISTAKQGKTIMSLIAEEEGIKESSIIGNDLFLYVRDKGEIWGTADEFVGSPRLDDQECVWCSLMGFTAAENSEYVKMLCVFDNEEVGSRTKQGADSDFLLSIIERINDNLGRNREQYYTAFANSFMISADNAHAFHPAHGEKYDPMHSPEMNGGIVLKFSARQSYTTDGYSAAFVRKLCEDRKIPCQIFVNHSDQPGGSTLGNISNSHVSLNTADIGLAQLAMHSAYEVAGVKDMEWLVDFSEGFFTSV
jgi:aspartyl aminopeptidase